jgi:hypothetical protein
MNGGPAGGGRRRPAAAGGGELILGDRQASGMLGYFFTNRIYQSHLLIRLIH